MPDWLIRAVKTFVQAFFGVLVPEVVAILQHGWRQPTGAQNAYMTGDKVHYPDTDGPVYVSIVDDNVWSPITYGWEVLA